MTSIGPYTQSFDMQQFYDFNKLRAPMKAKVYPKGSLMGILASNPDFTIFCYIVQKAQMDQILGDIQANFTLFVPSDEELRKRYSNHSFNKIDKGLAVHIVNFSIMNRKIDKYLLQSSPCSVFPTKNRSYSMYITNVDGVTLLPCDIRVVHWNQNATNGLIHVVDNLLVPVNSWYPF